MYAPHPIGLNPFKSALLDTFLKERKIAIENPNNDDASEREQLVWVLWKILRGDGQDLGPFSPSLFVRSALPPKLRALNLLLDEDSLNDDYAFPQAHERNELTREPEQLPSPVSPDADAHARILSQAMTLLLSARDRVLTLSEMRVLSPLLPELTSTPVLTSFDVPRVVANNPTLAYPLISAMLTHTNSRGSNAGLDVLAQLPPTLQSFDVIGRLLRDSTAVRDPQGLNTTVADMVRLEVLGQFITNSIRWLDEAEADEREGFISDDRFAQGVQNLCRFYNSLMKLRIVDPTSDIDSAEMFSFTLRHARFEEANTLYRALAAIRF